MNDVSAYRAAAPESPAGSAMKWLTVAMVASIVLPLALLAATAMLDYARVMALSTERVHKTASIAQEHALKVLETSEVIISRVVDLLGDDDDARITQREASLHAKLKAIQHDIEQVQGINAWTSDGILQVSSRFFPAPATDISDREDFAVHLARNTATHISQPLVGRTTGESFFNISRRRETAQGDFAGVVTVSLWPEYFAAFYRQLSTRRGDIAISIWREDGVLLARYPHHAGPVRMPPESALAHFIASRKEVGEARGLSTIDGVDRLFSFRRIGPYPLYVSAGLDYSAIMAEWYHNLATWALFAVPAALGLLLVTWLALQKTRREQTAIAQWHEEAERRASAEEALRQAQKLEAMGQLTGGVAHDFNNLLQVISTNLYILKLKGRDPTVEAQLAAIGRAVASGERLTKHLLGFSRRRPLQPRVMLLHERLDEIRTLVRHTLRGDVTLECRVEPGVWPIYVDPEELEMALLNIAVNARDALSAGGSVTLEARNISLEPKDRATGLRGDFVAISLTDSGHGMPPEILDRVFEPFFTTKAVGKGTGLGLSQVYGFAMQSGGAAKIDSAIGRGTQVTLFLPRSDALPEMRLEATPVPADGEISSGHVLLVEDNEEIGNAVSAVLREMGYTVRHATDADKALAAIRSGARYDLLITDIVMPGDMNGLDLARAVSRQFPGLSVLLMSGYTDEADRAAAEGYRILGKPFRPEALAEAIRRTRRSRHAPPMQAA